ncbi:hypothetical protein TNCV_146181 [Trichonephila clavipes]|nr:hypothetical protein TNCV_146181 [Trichonephila clavipes]
MVDYWTDSFVHTKSQQTGCSKDDWNKKIGRIKVCQCSQSDINTSGMTHRLTALQVTSVFLQPVQNNPDVSRSQRPPITSKQDRHVVHIALMDNVATSQELGLFARQLSA